MRAVQSDHAECVQALTNGKSDVDRESTRPHEGSCTMRLVQEGWGRTHEG